MVMCERWLCAPYSEISFEHGQQAGDWRLHREGGLVMAGRVHLGAHRHLVIEQAGHAGDRGEFFNEIGKAHFDIAGTGFEPGQHGLHQGAQAGHVQRRGVGMQHLEKARHVRALDVVRQPDIHVDGRHRRLLGAAGALYPQRKLDRLDADAVDGDGAPVRAGLYVGQKHSFGSIHGNPGPFKRAGKAGGWGNQRAASRRSTLATKRASSGLTALSKDCTAAPWRSIRYL